MDSIKSKKTFDAIDGDVAASSIAYDFADIAAYPNTPSSPMAEHTDAWSAKGSEDASARNEKYKEMGEK